MSGETVVEQGAIEAKLRPFMEANPHCSLSIENGCLLVDKPWGDDDARIIKEIDDEDFISTLNNLLFPVRFDAIINKNKNYIEFIYAFLNPNEERNKDLIDREFEIHFEGEKYKCYFAEPTVDMMAIAKAFRRFPSENLLRSLPQITQFSDYQNLDTLPERIQAFFSGKVARNFFIQSENNPIYQVDLEALAKHVNFISRYYDRESPEIVIKSFHEENSLTEPLRFIEGQFPKALVLRPIDDIILKLIDVGSTSSPRFSFLYFYQVFEYTGYYYIDDKVKNSLRKFLKDPALVNCAEEKVSELFNLFADVAHADDVKMKKVISEYCDPYVLWKEIENDKTFFSSAQDFEGGFTQGALVSGDTTASSWAAMWMPKLFDHLTKIRNSLVHARERRENKVILPTRSNNHKLKHYHPLMKRLAEQLALKT